jgi:HD-GYP domain-containing protein (c-di-GMP phosphodiesterase class II)
MIRISDIIKMGSGNHKPKNENQPLMKETHKKDIPAIVREAETRKQESTDLYHKGIDLVIEAFGKVKKDEEVYAAPILNFSKNLVEEVLLEENEYFQQFYDDFGKKDYLPEHSLNVSFLAIKLGVWSGFNKSELMELAISGFLHDIGMTKFETIVQKESKLDAGERALVSQHPECSVQILERMVCLSEKGLVAVKTHHIKGPRDKFSEILSLADIYEAMTHARVYKKAKTPHQAIGEIIDKEALSFQPSVLKAFINNIGIYPIGSWVKLNTGEIGLVTGMNKGYPLRPKVNIIFSHAGERLNNAKVLDFLLEDYFYIDGAVSNTDLENLKLRWDKNKDALN